RYVLGAGLVAQRARRGVGLADARTSALAGVRRRCRRDGSSRGGDTAQSTLLVVPERRAGTEPLVGRGPIVRDRTEGSRRYESAHDQRRLTERLPVRRLPRPDRIDTDG